MAFRNDFKRILREAHIGFRAEYAVMMQGLADRVRNILVDFANMDGQINLHERNQLFRQAGHAAISLFVGPDERSPFGLDDVTALAPYPELLNYYLAGVQYEVFRIHHDYMRQHLPRNIFDWLANGLPREDLIQEIEAAEAARHEALRALFVSTERLEYDPSHFFVSPDGYRLSDRIWRTGVGVRDSLDRVLSGGIADGRSALQLARDVERMLIPGQAYPRTTGRRILNVIPNFRRENLSERLLNLYSNVATTRGRTISRIDQRVPALQRQYWSRRISYNGMRLARTEITAAFGRAMRVSAQVNPFVQHIQWLLSPSHPEIDICDAYHGQTYDPKNVPPYPAHPNCLCVLVPVPRNRDRVVRELRTILEDEREGLRPYVNTADLKQFTDDVLGDLSAYLPQDAAVSALAG